MKTLNLFLWPFLLPLLFLVYILWPKARPHFGERLGLGRVRLKENGYLLFHVASLGEARGARRLIDALSHQVPLIMTTMTLTGREALSKAHPEIPSSLAPLDLPGLWTPFLKSRRIRGILLFETEIWPAMLTSAHELGIPVGLVNGRLSSRSFKRYKALTFIVRPFLKRFSLVTVQSDRDRNRFIALGVPEHIIHLTGNLKWDVDEASLSSMKDSELSSWLGQSFEKKENPKTLHLLGSSVHPGEAMALVKACQRLSETGRPISLILAPRHLETLPGLLSDLPSSVKISVRAIGKDVAGEKFRREDSAPSSTLFILNTYGELGAVTGFADIVFVGGTLDPVGGHSPVEAAFHGKPILWGPHRDHIADLANNLARAGASIDVTSEEDLEKNLAMLWDDEEKRQQMGDASRGVFESCKGPLEKTLSALNPMIRTLFPGRG